MISELSVVSDKERNMLRSLRAYKAVDKHFMMQNCKISANPEGQSNERGKSDLFLPEFHLQSVCLLFEQRMTFLGTLQSIIAIKKRNKKWIMSQNTMKYF